MSRVFANPLTELAEYEEMDQDLNRGKGPIQMSGCMDSQKVHLMEEAGESCLWKLVVTYDDSRAKEIYEDFRCFQNSVYLYPSRDLLFYTADIHGNLLTKQRLQVLKHLIEDHKGVVVTTLDGLSASSGSRERADPYGKDRGGHRCGEMEEPAGGAWV